MGHRAQRKKGMKKFKVGDLVTWGIGSSAHPVLEVKPEGVVVDGGKGFERHFVAWDGGALGKGPSKSGPLRHVEKK